MVVRQTGWCVMFHSPNGVALPAFRHAKPILGNEKVRVRAFLTLALFGAYRYRCDRAWAPVAVRSLVSSNTP